MKLKQLKVNNFGKLNNREIQFADGINIVYGPNESGKTTLHEFIKGMFYGITRQRGRASRNDLYTRYEPWGNSSYFAGVLRFESGSKDFRITRNFYKNDIKEEFVCETDGERLSVDNGDMDVLLGDVSEAVFDNTISIGQMRSRTDESLYQELRNYMTNYEGSGDWALDIGQALKSLKSQEKEYNSLQRTEKVGQETRKRELQMNINYLQNEIAGYEERATNAKAELAVKREALSSEHQHKEGLGKASNAGGNPSLESISITDNTPSKKGFLIALLICLGIIALSTPIWEKAFGRPMIIWSALAFAGASMAAGIIFWHDSKKAAVAREVSLKNELARQIALSQAVASEEAKEDAFQDKVEEIKLIEGKLAQLEEMVEEKKTQLDNCQMDYWEYTANTGQGEDNQVEIEALQLAMEMINEISVAGTRRMEKQFHQRISDILKEITNGKYDRVILDENHEIELNSADKQIPLWTLSKGTIEQVYFALRMAAAEIFCTEDMPVLLDEVFAMYDEERLASALSWLVKNKTQVVIFTCNTREAELANRLKLSVNNISL